MKKRSLAPRGPDDKRHSAVFGLVLKRLLPIRDGLKKYAIRPLPMAVKKKPHPGYRDYQQRSERPA
jgi:hypothetical protein